MGVTIYCNRKDGHKGRRGHRADMSYFGFARLKTRIAAIQSEELYKHYSSMYRYASDHMFNSDEDAEFWRQFDRRTDELVESGVVPGTLMSFLFANDSDGAFGWKGCKLIREVIGDYDDNIIYGYAGRPDHAMFKDFVQILDECIENKCEMRWN